MNKKAKGEQGERKIKRLRLHKETLAGFETKLRLAGGGALTSYGPECSFKPGTIGCCQIT